MLRPPAEHCPGDFWFLRQLSCEVDSLFGLLAILVAYEPNAALDHAVDQHLGRLRRIFLGETF